MPDTFTNLLYHLIFSTKGRAPLITRDLAPQLHAYIGGILRREGCTLLGIGGTSDHIHILGKLRADLSLSDVVRTIKCNASKWVNESPGMNGRFSWQNGYGAFTVSESRVASVLAYIENQARHHQSKTFQDELSSLLRKNRFAHDERQSRQVAP